MDKSIINTDSYAKMRAKYQKSQEWRNYARRCIKNKFVQSYLLARDKNTCRYCGRRIFKQFNIHHMTYDHCCKSGDTIIQISPTPKRPQRHLHVPDCEQCLKQTPELFEECMEKLCVVHGGCNAKISLEKQGKKSFQPP